MPAQAARHTQAQFQEDHPQTFANYLARRKTVFAVAFFGYVCAYLVRNNFKLTSESLRLENGWSLTEVGVVLSAFTVTYGFGKFVMGMVVDRVSMRRLFAGALAISAVLCILLGFVSSLPVFFVAMLLLGMVQGALAPSSMSMIANWYPNRLRGSRIAVWNVSQNVGGAGLPLMIAGLLAWAGPSHAALAFFVPGVLVLVLAFVFYKYGGDRPEEEGMPSLRTMYGAAGEPEDKNEPDASYWSIIRKDVFGSRLILTVASINALLYFLRFGIQNWMPAFLGTEQGFSQVQYTTAFSVLEWCAIPGSFFFAWVSTKLPNKQSLVGFLGLLLLAGFVWIYANSTSYPMLLGVSSVMGTLIYGPQLIVNILALNFVPLRAAGVAVGFVGLFGYIIGEFGANLIMPILAETFSWGASFAFLSACSVLAGLLYLSLRRQESATLSV